MTEKDIVKRIDFEESFIRSTEEDPRRLSIFLSESVRIRMLLRTMPEEFQAAREVLFEGKNKEDYLVTRTQLHHDDKSTYYHMLLATHYGIEIAKSKGKDKVDVEDLISGLMLHDLYLYDWHDVYHDFGPQRRGIFKFRNTHVVTHPDVALQNARELYPELLNDKVENIIGAHMLWAKAFLGVLDFNPPKEKLPLYKETLIAVRADMKASKGLIRVHNDWEDTKTTFRRYLGEEQQLQFAVDAELAQDHPDTTRLMMLKRELQAFKDLDQRHTDILLAQEPDQLRMEAEQLEQMIMREADDYLADTPFATWGRSQYDADVYEMKVADLERISNPSLGRPYKLSRELERVQSLPK